MGEEEEEEEGGKKTCGEKKKSDGSLSPAFSEKHVELSISARCCQYI